MRALLVALLACLAIWRAAIDWRATISEGYAFRFTPVGRVLGDVWPEMVAGLAQTGSVGTFLLSLPLALIPAVLALLLWITRRRHR